MIIFYPIKEKKPADWPFMAESKKVLDDFPDTWKAYNDDIIGAMAIIDMEYDELKKATDLKNAKHELIHLASACLNLWRKL